MRFERHGGAPDLQAAFKELISSHLRGRMLDDNQAQEASEGEFPDFACFRDLLLIEMKHLETDQQDRIDEIFEAKIDPAEKPLFYGSREANLVTDALSNGATINAAIASKLGRTIETILSKANRQFRSYRSRHPRKNSVSICAILNSTRREWSPDVVVHSIHGKMKMGGRNEPRFGDIDAVLFISEKHFQMLPDGRPAHALVIYQGFGVIDQPWKLQFIERIVDGWSRMRTGDLAVESADRRFATVEDIPGSMRRSDVWRLEYKRNPYLRTLSVKQLRRVFHRTIAVNSLSFLNGAWPKPSEHETAEGLRRFTHVIEETNRRGLDLRLFDRLALTPMERSEVYAGLPDELAAILSPKTDPGSI